MIDLQIDNPIINDFVSPTIMENISPEKIIEIIKDIISADKSGRLFVEFAEYE